MEPYKGVAVSIEKNFIEEFLQKKLFYLTELDRDPDSFFLNQNSQFCSSRGIHVINNGNSKTITRYLNSLFLRTGSESSCLCGTTRRSSWTFWPGTSVSVWWEKQVTV